MSDAALTDYRVGDWRVRVDRHELERGGELRRLQPRLVALLGCLAAAAGRTVTREELLARVWQRRMVNDEVLSRAIADLRRALDDDARQASMIETVPKLGYRLCVPVELVAEEAAFINSGDPGSDATAESSAPAAFIKSSASRRVVVVAALAAAVAVLVATWWSGVRGDAAGHHVAGPVGCGSGPRASTGGCVGTQPHAPVFPPRGDFMPSVPSPTGARARSSMCAPAMAGLTAGSTMTAAGTCARSSPPMART